MPDLLYNLSGQQEIFSCVNSLACKYKTVQNRCIIILWKHKQWAAIVIHMLQSKYLLSSDNWRLHLLHH